MLPARHRLRSSADFAACFGGAPCRRTRAGSRLLVVHANRPTRVRVNRRGSVLLCPRPWATPSSATAPSAVCAHAMAARLDRRARRLDLVVRANPPAAAAASSELGADAGPPDGHGAAAPRPSAVDRDVLAAAAAHAGAPPRHLAPARLPAVHLPDDTAELPLLPSCSAYAITAIERFGVAQGLLARGPTAAALPPVEPRGRRPRSAGRTLAPTGGPGTPHAHLH